MPKIQVTNKEGEGLPAVIFQNDAGVAAADINGFAEVPAGDYVSKIIGYGDKPFRVHNQDYVHPVVMREAETVLGDVNIVAERTIKQNKWLIFGGLALIIGTLIYTVK